MRGIYRIAAIIMMLGMASGHADARLAELYKRGKVVLKADSEFGKGMDWDDIFPASASNVAVSPEGSVFVVNPSFHNILKFDSCGRLQKTIGRQGDGPGDLYSPGAISILDEKYLVAGEYAESRRISIFHLSGSFFRLIKTRYSCFSPISLKNNLVAYYSIRTLREDREASHFITLVTVIIKNIDSGKEITVDSTIWKNPCLRLRNGAIAGVGNFMGSPVLAGTPDGNLLFGLTNEKKIKIISPRGKILNAISLEISPAPVTSHYIEVTKKNVLANLRSLTPDEAYYQYLRKELQRSDFKKLFGSTLPMYRQLFIDADGNILVFKWPAAPDKSHLSFQVYSPAGVFLCETSVDEGIFDFQLDTVYRNIQFTGKGIFAFLKLKDSGEGETQHQLIRVSASDENS